LPFVVVAVAFGAAVRDAAYDGERVRSFVQHHFEHGTATFCEQLADHE